MTPMTSLCFLLGRLPRKKNNNCWDTSIAFDRRAAPLRMVADHAASAGTVVDVRIVFCHSYPSVHCITPGMVRLGTLL
jgi:hypothetical protein